MPRINGKPVSTDALRRQSKATKAVDAAAKAARNAASSLDVASPVVIASGAQLRVSEIFQLLALPLGDRLTASVLTRFRLAAARWGRQRRYHHCPPYYIGTFARARHECTSCYLLGEIE